MNTNAWRTLAAATTAVVLVAGSTAMSSLFVVYRAEWGISSSDIAIVFAAYVAALLPVLLLFGGLAERFGRRPVIVAGILSMLAGLVTVMLAHNVAMLIVSRLLQGAGVGLSIGALTAAVSESYRGKLPVGNVLQAVAAVALFSGPAISAVAFNLGGGLSFSYVPSLVLLVAVLALTPFIAERATAPGTGAPVDEAYAAEVVARALRFAFPLAFVSWAGLSLFLSLVPAYLATALHASNPAIGAGAVVAMQFASLIVTLSLRNISAERGGIIGAVVSLSGIAVLIAGTTVNSWGLIVVATLMVGGGGGLASSASYGIAQRIGRGHRVRTFARWYVAAYAGYSIPVLAIGLIASHTSFEAAFTAVTAGLALVVIALPFLRPSRNRDLVPERNIVARAA